MIVNSRLKEYSVTFENDLSFISSIIVGENSFHVVDKNVFLLYKNLFREIPEQRLFILEATEEKKNMDTVVKVCGEITQLSSKRNMILVSYGGGIIQDVTGFVANILYRGIGWIYLPTTLLSACDSCIGSKTSLNYNQYKNLLGTFYPPDEIFICSKFFDTLSDKDFKSGLGEIVKLNLMKGEEGLGKIEHDIAALLDKDKKVIDEYVRSSLLLKKTYIEQDEFDRGVRVLLNFAHTFGHALEVVSEYELPHGTAVALGIIMANTIAVERSILKKDYQMRIEKLIGKIIPAINSTWFNFNEVINAIHKDKKQTDARLTAILMDDDFKLASYNDITNTEIENAILHMLYMSRAGA